MTFCVSFWKHWNSEKKTLENHHHVRASFNGTLGSDLSHNTINICDVHYHLKLIEKTENPMSNDILCIVHFMCESNKQTNTILHLANVSHPHK